MAVRMDPAVGIPISVGVTAAAGVCTDAGAAAAVDNVTNKRKARHREFMRRSHWFRRHWASMARVEPDWIEASIVPRSGVIWEPAANIAR
jgi:hypothetical protein